MLYPSAQETPIAHFGKVVPNEPVLYFSKADLRERLEVFQNGLGGTVSYAVKCNAHATIIEAMVDCGIEEFDVASPAEIALVRGIAPFALMNYNNPIRSREEIRFALKKGVRSFSVDCVEELEKLAEFAPKGTEISVRLKLDLDGSAYHFGDKFGETPEMVVELLKRVVALGFEPSATFHVGTQCENPENYRIYIETMAQCVNDAGVTLKRLNVGGGFPSARNGVTPEYSQFFAAIQNGLKAFPTKPEIVAEPGRALIADACQYVVRIKSLRHGRWAFLNDGVYGGLSDVKLMGSTPYSVFDRSGVQRTKAPIKYNLYGPTCDSIDTFTEIFHFPEDTVEGDFVLFNGAGAYLLGLNTSFNGYGEVNFVEVESLSL